jgi:hypothetical protein
MPQWRTHLMLAVLLPWLMAIPCAGGPLTPVKTTPDVQLAALADITVTPIAYQGPVLSDIGMKLITYDGPQLADIAVAPIAFAHPTVSVVTPPSTAQTVAPAAKPAPVALIPQPIPGVPPGVKILSPKPGQKLAAGVPLEIAVTGWQGTPRVELDWWWSAPTAAGQWPATPQRMTVVDHLEGQTRLVIPRSAFPQPGLWRLEASVRLTDTRRVIDAVSFSLLDAFHGVHPSGTMDHPGTPAAPVPKKPLPSAARAIHPLPVAPAGKEPQTD